MHPDVHVDAETGLVGKTRGRRFRFPRDPHRRTQCPPGVVLVPSRISEDEQEPIRHQGGDDAAALRCDASIERVLCVHDLIEILELDRTSVDVSSHRAAGDERQLPSLTFRLRDEPSAEWDSR